MNWRPIEEAPHDGTPVLLAVMLYNARQMSEAHKQVSGKLPAVCVMARWSTWDGIWKRVGDGEEIRFPLYFNPHAFALIDDMPLKDHYSKQENE